MIALIMAASLLGSVILICVCAPLAPAAPPAPPAPYVFEQDAPLLILFSQQFKPVFSQIRKEREENTGCGMIRSESKCGGTIERLNFLLTSWYNR